MDSKKLETNSFFFLLLLAGVLTFFIFLPYLSSLVLAITFAIVFRPIYEWLRRDIGGPKSLAALIMVLLILVLIIGPLTFLGLQVFKEARDVYVSLSNSGEGGFAGQLTGSIESMVKRFNPEFTFDFKDYTTKTINWFTSNLGRIFSGLTRFIINLFIGIIALFYLFRDGEKIDDFIIKYSPLSKTYKDDILEKLKLTINSVVRGSLIVALVQGLIAGIGFWIFRVPNPAFWGMFVVIAALIPSVGTAIVVIPAVLYLYFTGESVAALGLLAWGILVVGLVDNFLRPYLIERGIKIHPLLILLSVLGGLQLFGPIGFVAGPLVLSFLFTLLNIYPLMVKTSRRSRSDA